MNRSTATNLALAAIIAVGSLSALAVADPPPASNRSPCDPGWIVAMEESHFGVEAMKEMTSREWICNAVDGEGNVWIGSPQRGHWLDEDGLAVVAKALRAGDI